MSAGRRLYILTQLSTTDRALVERLEAGVLVELSRPNAAGSIVFPLPLGASEAATSALAQIFTLAGWRAGLRRGNGWALVLNR